MDQFSTGLRDVGRGLAALNAHPRLWKYVIAPALITAVLLVALVLGAVHLSQPVVAWVAVHLPGWLAGVAGSLLHVVIGVATAAAIALVFVPVAGIVAGPFAEALSEHLEAALTGRPSPPFRFAAFAHGLALAISHGLRRLVAALAGLVVVLALGLVPVIGSVAAIVATAWLASHGAAYDCYDAVLARRTLGYGDKLAYLARHRHRTTGLGAAVAGLLLVPGLNLVALGLGAAGATVAALELEGRLPGLPAARANAAAR